MTDTIDHTQQKYGKDRLVTLATRPETIPDAFVGDPVKSRAESTTVSATNTLQDFADAISHTNPTDIDLRSPVMDESEDGLIVREPSWTGDESDAQLLELDHEWIYTEGLVRLDALQVVALEEGIIDEVTTYPTGTDFHPAIKVLRNRGASIPQYEWEYSSNGRARFPESIPVLPPEEVPTPLTQGNIVNSTESELTMEAARNRCQAEIRGAIRRGDPTLVDALPTLGKSYGTILAAAETGEPITLLTCRGHKEQYEQFEDWADDHELSCRRLPSFFHLCPSAPTESPETEIEEQVLDWYARGAEPQTIHDRAVEVLGSSLPCQQDGECPYMSAWDFEPDKFDVLLGYYTHAHVPPAIMGRTVVLDEFPGDAFETTLDTTLPNAITHFLESYEDLPFESYTELLEHRDMKARCEAALEWFTAPDDSYADTIFEDDTAHAAAPLAVYTLLTAVDLGNGWERAWPVGEDDGALDRIGLFDRKNGAVYLLQPPDITPARNVIALDGTPTPAMWELSLGIELEQRHVLSEAEKRAYIRDALQHEYIRTTEHLKPYNGAGVSPKKDAALLTGIRDRHGEKPCLITTQTAEEIYEEKGIVDIVDAYQHYGNLLGSNRFKYRRFGAVIGSNHFGDGFVEKWSAYAGVVAERNGKGSELSYGSFGDKVLRHMYNETLQAVMRFGRDGEGATVYVHTNALPDWVPIAAEGRLVKAWSPGAKQVIEAAAGMESWRTTDLTEHPAVEVGERQIRNILHDLADRGYVDICKEGRGYRWQNAGLVNALDGCTIDESRVPEIGTSSIYRWDFRKTTE